MSGKILFQSRDVDPSGASRKPRTALFSVLRYYVDRGFGGDAPQVRGGEVEALVKAEGSFDVIETLAASEDFRLHVARSCEPVYVVVRFEDTASVTREWVQGKLDRGDVRETDLLRTNGQQNRQGADETWREYLERNMKEGPPLKWLKF